MKHFIIDGNNLIGKINDLWKLQKKNPQASREKLALKLDRFFAAKNYKTTLHFDGFAQEAIKTNFLKIEYSDNKTADENIKFEIEISNNPKHITLVSSDHNLIEFARVCSCSVKRSEDFAREIKKVQNQPDESQLANDISNDEIKRLFGVLD